MRIMTLIEFTFDSYDANTRIQNEEIRQTQGKASRSKNERKDLSTREFDTSKFMYIYTHMLRRVICMHTQTPAHTHTLKITLHIFT